MRGLLLPPTAWLVVFLVIPTAVVAAMAFSPEGLKALGDGATWALLGRSFAVAAVSTALCLAVSYPVAYFVAGCGPTWRNFLLFLVVLPFWTNLLVRTYSTALAVYRDRTIVYKPLRLVRGDTDVTVRSEVKQGGGQLKIDYDMVKTPEGWKVYDVKMDGVSLVTAYREGFAAKVRDAGVDGLIKALAEKNRQGDSAARPAGAIAARSQ